MSTCTHKTCTAPAQSRKLCESHYRKRVRMGIYGYRDAGPTRDHVAALRSLGWTWQAIGNAAGLSNYVAHHIGNSTSKRVLPESERAILGIPLTPYDSQRSVDSAGTRRRVQALAWMGWTCAEVARRAGTTESTLRTLMLPSRRISYRLARQVAAVYDDLSMKTGPSKAAAGQARGFGFAPPMAWNDHTINDPNTKPHWVRTQEAAA